MQERLSHALSPFQYLHFPFLNSNLVKVFLTGTRAASKIRSSLTLSFFFLFIGHALISSERAHLPSSRQSLLGDTVSTALEIQQRHTSTYEI